MGEKKKSHRCVASNTPQSESIMVTKVSGLDGGNCECPQGSKRNQRTLRDLKDVAWLQAQVPFKKGIWRLNMVEGSCGGERGGATRYQPGRLGRTAT